MKPISSSLTSHAQAPPSLFTPSFLRRIVRVLGIAVCIYIAHPWGSSYDGQQQEPPAAETVTVKAQDTTASAAASDTSTPPAADITTNVRQTSGTGSDPSETNTNNEAATTENIEPATPTVTTATATASANQDDLANTQVLYNPDPTLVQQDTYYFPLDKQPDPILTTRVMAAFPSANDPGRQAVLGEDNNNNKCEVTSMMRIIRNDMTSHDDSAKQDDASLWTLTTFNLQQQPKTIGGDDYYITYTAEGHSEPTAIAFVQDWHNGNYSFQFVSSPTAPPRQKIQDIADQSSGTLTVILEQSCGMGFLAPPLKNAWLTSGAINQQYTLPGIRAPKHIQKFVPPNANKRIDLGSFHEIAVVGDTLLGQFVCAENDQPSPDQCGTFPGRNNIYRGAPMLAALHTQTMANPFLMRAHTDIQQATEIGMRRLQEAAMAKSRQKGVMREGELFPRDGQGKVIFSLNHLRTMQGLPEIIPSNEQLRKTLKIALVIGSGVWDILANDQTAGGQNFETHLMAAEQLILSIREGFPQITIFWKSMTAMHIHSVAVNLDWVHNKHVYYMSNSRARHLDQLQKALMKRLNVPVLDVFDATYYAAHKTRRGDGRHYQPDFNQRALGWFYPGK